MNPSARALAAATRGPVALALAFAVIALLSLIEFVAPRVTSSSGPVVLPVIGRAQLIGVGSNTSFLAGATPDVLYGVTPAHRKLTVERWDLGLPSVGRTIRPSVVTVSSAARLFALTYWSRARIPALLVATPARAGSRLQVFDLRSGARLASAVSAAALDDVSAITESDWNGAGVDLVLVRQARGGKTSLVVLSGALGTGPRLATVSVADRAEHASVFPPGYWRLAIRQQAQGRPSLAWITRGPTGSRRTELHLMVPSGRYSTFGEQAPTVLSDHHPDLHYAFGTGVGRSLVYAIDSRHFVYAISLAPIPG
ncbi:MAG: hypothetical protein ACYDHH_01650 [Solirubrobacteraceae bacterium]